MKLSTDIFARILQASGKAVGRESLSALDVEMPAAIVAVLQASAPFTSLSAVGVASSTQRDSCVNNLQVVQGPSSGGGNAVLLQLGKGAWRIGMSLVHLSDFTQQAYGAGMRLTTPDGNTSQDFVRLPMVVNVPMIWDAERVIVLINDDWTLRVVTGATGVGQNTITFACAWARRML